MQKTGATRKNLSVATVSGHLTLDSSVLVELLDGSDIGSRLTGSLLSEEITAHVSLVNMAEAEYILCRKIGHDAARNAVEDLLNSGYLAVEEDPAIHAGASRLKCERSISLADCYTFAVATVTSSRPLFLSKEEELLKEMKKKPFEVEPLFLT